MTIMMTKEIMVAVMITIMTLGIIMKIIIIETINKNQIDKI